MNCAFREHLFFRLSHHPHRFAYSFIVSSLLLSRAQLILNSQFCCCCWCCVGDSLCRCTTRWGERTAVILFLFLSYTAWTSSSSKAKMIIPTSIHRSILSNEASNFRVNTIHDSPSSRHCTRSLASSWTLITFYALWRCFAFIIVLYNNNKGHRSRPVVGRVLPLIATNHQQTKEIHLHTVTVSHVLNIGIHNNIMSVSLSSRITSYYIRCLPTKGPRK